MECLWLKQAGVELLLILNFIMASDCDTVETETCIYYTFC